MRENAIRRGAERRAVVIGAIAIVAAVLSAVAGVWFVGVALAVIGGATVYIVLNVAVRQGNVALDVAANLITHFEVGGTPHDRLRLSTIVERLSATFGLDAVSCMVVEDTTPNATLLVDRQGYSLLVTTGMMERAELIELEGVVAHCMARQRLGYLQLAASAANGTSARKLFDRLCPDFAYRADEVAAATIRYPVGLASALRHCATATPSATSYFASEAYRRERMVWFDPFIDGNDTSDDDRNRAAVRASALEEW